HFRPSTLLDPKTYGFRSESPPHSLASQGPRRSPSAVFLDRHPLALRRHLPFRGPAHVPPRSGCPASAVDFEALRQSRCSTARYSLLLRQHDSGHVARRRAAFIHFRRAAQSKCEKKDLTVGYTVYTIVAAFRMQEFMNERVAKALSDPVV